MLILLQFRGCPRKDRSVKKWVSRSGSTHWPSPLAMELSTSSLPSPPLARGVLGGVLGGVTLTLLLSLLPLLRGCPWKD